MTNDILMKMLTEMGGWDNTSIKRMIEAGSQAVPVEEWEAYRVSYPDCDIPSVDEIKATTNDYYKHVTYEGHDYIVELVL